MSFGRTLASIGSGVTGLGSLIAQFALQNERDRMYQDRQTAANEGAMIRAGYVRGDDGQWTPGAGLIRDMQIDRLEDEARLRELQSGPTRPSFEQYVTEQLTPDEISLLTDMDSLPVDTLRRAYFHQYADDEAGLYREDHPLFNPRWRGTPLNTGPTAPASPGIVQRGVELGGSLIDWALGRNPDPTAPSMIPGAAGIEVGRLHGNVLPGLTGPARVRAFETRLGELQDEGYVDEQGNIVQPASVRTPRSYTTVRDARTMFPDLMHNPRY